MDRIQIAIIAVALGLIVLALMNSPTAPPPQPQSAPAEAPTAGSPTPIPEAPPGSSPGVAPPPRPQETPKRAVVRGPSTELVNDALTIRVNSVGGRIDSIRLNDYADRIGDDAHPVELVTAEERGTLLAFLGKGPLLGLESVEHTIVSQDALSVELRAERDGVEVKRKISLDETGYGGWLRLSIRNRSAGPIEPRFDIAWYGRERASDAPDHFQNYSFVAYADEGVERLPVLGVGSPGFLGGLFGGGSENGSRYPAPVEWSGVDSQYFLLAAIPENPREASAFIGPLGSDFGQSVLSYPAFSVPTQTSVERTYRLYMGPKVSEHVNAVSPALDPATIVGWGWVRPLVSLFANLLKWTYDNIVSNYGVAIILLTILLRLVTYPLTQRSMKSMKRFSLIAPEMKALQDKYADDKVKLQEELMSLYRQKGMNPLTAMGGGCLPMLIQMPFMIALYFALQSSIELRHAPFVFWINDLSAPENLASIAGLPIRILPLLMGASMLLQQRLTPTPNADPQQKQMMQWMSVMFIFLFYQFPSGLVLYWFVSNVLGIAQQLLVNRSPDKAAAAAS